MGELRDHDSRETFEFKRRRTTNWSLAPQDDEPSDTNRFDFVGSLYQNILILFRAVLAYLENEATKDRVDLSKPLRRGLKDTYDRLLMWARDHGLKEGKLDEVLQESQSVRRLTMRVLLKMSGTLGQGLYLTRPLISHKLRTVKLPSARLTD
jgi:hypothetical protein